VFIYNSKKYNQGKYSTGNPIDKQGHLYYGSVIAGIEARKQIGKKYIYRIHPGNGLAKIKIGKNHQHRYDYFIPNSIDNIESDPWRTTFKAATQYWKHVLTDEQKAEYNSRGSKTKQIPGRSLFISEAMKGIYHMFVDRGDPAAVDFELTDLTTDAAWNNLDLSGIIPTITRAVIIELDTEAAQSNREIIFRKYGNTNEINHTGSITKANNKDMHKTCIIAVDENRKVEYKADDVTWSVINLTIRGWIT